MSEQSRLKYRLPDLGTATILSHWDFFAFSQAYLKEKGSIKFPTLVPVYRETFNVLRDQESALA